MNHYKAHFSLGRGVWFTLDVQFEIDHYPLPDLYREMEELAGRLGATFQFVEPSPDVKTA